MGIGFYGAESCAVHGIGENFSDDVCDDIIIHLDADGFLTCASENASSLGVDFGSLLLMPHIADLAAPDFAKHLSDYCASILTCELQGQGQDGWIEFPISTFDAQAGEPSSDGDEEVGRHTHWYALNLRPIVQQNGELSGAVGLLRSVNRKHAHACEINEQAARDPITGLANRHALRASLTRVISSGRNDEGVSATMAVFAIDRMRAIFMQYGQSTADEIRWGFARYLGTMTSPPHELAQMDDERFGVILDGMAMRDARSWASDVLNTFAGLTMASPGRTPELSASAGLAKVEDSVDWTLRQAELGLVLARAGGGMKTGVCQPSCPVASGDAVERAMDAALKRAERQSGKWPARRTAR